MVQLEVGWLAGWLGGLARLVAIGWSLETGGWGLDAGDSWLESTGWNLVAGDRWLVAGGSGARAWLAGGLEVG